jgi:holo-[acyl-carrier protein] synthase
MAIRGVGIDIVETRRIRDICEREPAFVGRVFTETELHYCQSRRNKFLHLAVRFAAKEAVAKAFGRSFSWQDVEIESCANGAPRVRLWGNAAEAAGGARVHVSLSHTGDYATAVAVLED